MCVDLFALEVVVLYTGFGIAKSEYERMVRKKQAENLLADFLFEEVCLSTERDELHKVERVLDVVYFW